MYISVSAVLEMIAYERKKELGNECKEFSIVIAEPFFEVLLDEHGMKNRGDVRTLKMNVFDITFDINLADQGELGDKEFYLVLLGRPYYVTPEIVNK